VAALLVGCRVESPDDGAVAVATTAAPLIDDGRADGVFGQPDFTSSEPPVTVSSTTTTHPTFVATDTSYRNPSYVLVADREAHRGLLLSVSGGSWVFAGLYGQSSINASLPNQGLLQPAQFTLHTPMAAAFATSIAEVPGTLNWVAVADTANHRVLVSNNFGGGWNPTMVVGQDGDFTTGIPSKGGVSSSSLDQPSGVAFDPNFVPARLYVSDTGHHRILRFDAVNTPKPTAAAVFGQPSFVSDAPDGGEPGPNARGLSSPGGIYGWFLSTNLGDPLRGLWVADTGNHRVIHVANSGVADFVLGQPDLVSNKPNAFGASARSLRGPSAVAVDPVGNVWVADTGNHRVLRFKKGATTADAVLGQPDFASISPPTIVSAQTLYLPSGVAVNGNGDLYVADTGASRVLRYSVDCAKPSVCNDGDPCTDDFCDPTYHCYHSLNTFSKECAPYTCAIAQRRCAGSCDTAHPCAFGTTCVAGRCLRLCTTDAQCPTAHCAGGVCCDTACDGLCESCRILGHEGTCTVVPAGTVPTDPKTCPGGSTGCSHACNGVDRDRCEDDPAGTSCGVSSCREGVETPLGKCDGLGACLSTPKACAPYACTAAACRARCDFDHDCVGGAQCLDGACVNRRPAGGGCGLATPVEATPLLAFLAALGALGVARRRR